MLLVLPAVPLLGSFTFMIEPPLQRYYLTAYVVSAKVFRQSSATTPVIWLYKTAPGRRRSLLTERDVESAKSGTFGLRLSPAALADGWTGIQDGAQEHVNSAELHAFLQAKIYDGHSSEWVIVEPLLLGFLGVAGFFAVVIAIRRRSKLSRRHEERNEGGPRVRSWFRPRSGMPDSGQMEFSSSCTRPPCFAKYKTDCWAAGLPASAFAETWNRVTSY
jgi:hypothetical protein